MPSVLSWRSGGLLLGAVALAAFIFMKPIGVSTQFVIADGILLDAVNPTLVVEDPAARSGYASPNTYLNKSGGKYAKNVAEPMNYDFVFVLALFAGALLSSLLNGDKPANAAQKIMPDVWRERFGPSAYKRYMAVFFAGFIVLFGARLASGCTSGHMMIGMMQTSVSGYMFTLAAFGVGIPAAILLYNKRKG